MKNKKIKILIIILIIIALYSLVTIFLINNNSSTDEILVIGNNAWYYKDDKWNVLDNYNNKKNYVFKTYINNQYNGEFVIKKNPQFELYSNRGLVDNNGYLFAYTKNIDLKMHKYNVINNSVDELNEISKILNMNIYSKDLSIDELVTIDLDNNGLLDKIVNVSNLDALDSQEKYFNLTYLKLNNEDIQIINKEFVLEEEILNKPVYNIKYIFDYNDNNNIVIEEGYFSNAGDTNYKLYSLDIDKYQIIN